MQSSRRTCQAVVEALSYRHIEVGSFIGLLVTMVLNPLLYHFEILTSWRVGDKTVPTLFKNN